jgi:hypothetical protein
MPIDWATLDVRAERLPLNRGTPQANRYISEEINYKVDWLFLLRLTIESPSRH